MICGVALSQAYAHSLCNPGAKSVMAAAFALVTRKVEMQETANAGIWSKKTNCWKNSADQTASMVGIGQTFHARTLLQTDQEDEAGR